MGVLSKDEGAAAARGHVCLSAHHADGWTRGHVRPAVMPAHAPPAARPTPLRHRRAAAASDILWAMPLIVLENARLRLALDPALGAGIADFSLAGPAKGWYPIMRRAAPEERNPSNLACFTMAPWCNRVRDAAFTFAGAQRALRPTSAPGVTPIVAQHGDVRARAWTILDRSPISARFAFTSREHERVNFPWAFTALIRYELRDDRLLIDLALRNDDAEPFPAGLGLHPYFVRRLLRDDDAVELRAPCRTRYPIRDGLPTSPATPAPDPLMDALARGGPLPREPLGAVFGGFDGSATITWPQSRVRLVMTCSPTLGHLVVFAPHSTAGGSSALPYFAVEPVSNVNDAFNLHAQGHAGTGTLVLQPGQRLEACYAMVVEAL